MNYSLWHTLRKMRRKKTGRNWYGLKEPFGDTVNRVARMKSKQELRNLALSEGLSSDEYEVLSGLFDTLKKGIAAAGKTVGGAISRVWQPIERAVQQRTQYEIDTAGQRIAAQIAPPTAPTPMPQMPQTPEQPSTMQTILKYAPLALGGLAVIALLRRRD